MILFRGMASTGTSLRREGRLATSVAGKVLLLDAYNQLLAIMHYRDGRPVFIASDGFLRDVGASHGHIPDEGRFVSAMEAMAAALHCAAPARIEAYFDAPVSGSARHARLFGEILLAKGLAAEARTALSADAPLKSAAEGWAVATGDSAVLDALGEGVVAFDAARAAIERAYGERAWADLRAFIDPGRP
jgi:hypothetical protein